MPPRNGSSGARCINLALFVASIVFIIDSNLEIYDLKARAKATNEHTLEGTIACQRRVLTWLTISFINYFFFLMVTVYLVQSRDETPRFAKKRFRIAVFLTFLLVPFMLTWNLYGNLMIKNEYF